MTCTKRVRKTLNMKDETIEIRFSPDKLQNCGKENHLGEICLRMDER